MTGKEIYRKIFKRSSTHGLLVPQCHVGTCHALSCQSAARAEMLSTGSSKTKGGWQEGKGGAGPGELTVRGPLDSMPHVGFRNTASKVASKYDYNCLQRNSINHSPEVNTLSKLHFFSFFFAGIYWKN